MSFTLLLKAIDVSLHDKHGEISIEDLHWIIEDLALYLLALMIFLDEFGIDFSFTLSE